jgi:autotransporter passenger strand-loop-strand repeat protein
MAYDAFVSAGGTQHDSGVTSGTTLLKGGVETILSGGRDYYAEVRGSEVVSLGGAAYYDTVEKGGAQTVYGVTSDTTILKGGAETILSGGHDYYGHVYGSELVSSGGSVYSDTVYSGGVLTISPGGSVTGGLTISGGTAAISGAVAAGQQVHFSGSGDLALYDLAAFHAKIGGYSTGDEFDLGGFAHSARETRSFKEAANLTSGTLTVTAGANVTSLTLLGSYVTSDFGLSADGHGGTFVRFV